MDVMRRVRELQQGWKSTVDILTITMTATPCQRQPLVRRRQGRGGSDQGYPFRRARLEFL